MDPKERIFRECPSCGILVPWIQWRCDCGYRFRRKLPHDSRLSILVFVLSVLLALSVGYIISNESARWSSSSPASAAGTPAPSRAPASMATHAPAVSPDTAITQRDDSAEAGLSGFDRLNSLMGTSGGTASSAPRPVSISSGDIVKDTSAEKVAPLTVKTSGSSNYYVCLKCLRTVGSGGRMLPSLASEVTMSFYVSGGKTEEILVPLGEYELYYATGKTWYGKALKFGSETKYCKCEDSFLFTESETGYNGWSVTLYPVYNGNLDTETVSAADFPE